MKSRRLLLLLVALSPAVCFAEPSVTEESPSSSASSAPTQTYTVQVGLADHKFQPDTVQAGIGDIVEFRFYPANHSVVRAKYGLPCVPYEMTGSQRTGFFSGFKPVDKVLDDARFLATSTYKITDPIRRPQITPSESTILLQSSSTALLQGPVSATAWSAPSILTPAPPSLSSNNLQETARICLTPANHFH
ncbi:hypothetical protein HBH98_256280 [Parastagonospora nodorum]|nr:hypothetical protein HBH51_259600 [Parastagonospora nodorum]KAH4215231.1 hypothetical protein HBI06_258680 [Parastagonospora nodorum]KAH4219837.1 hypothetical protein HBI05_256940 [Parastagonospora nodorum]KAH4329957.1 hypothetical protein HBH98_256280 [Parastagonospora nodorum]KAH4358266.1 hypothetical protein HBH99_256470 [Parastagonospora nodorum]